MSELNHRWLRWIAYLPMRYDVRHIASVQRMYQHLTFKYRHDWDLSIEETGYTPVKLTQLRTYYMPQENLFRAADMMMARIEKRKYGSVLIPHQGRMKKGFTQNDYCMIGTTLTYYPKPQTISWTTHWRSTEAIKRCRGDFLLIRYMRDQLADLFKMAPVTDYTFKFDTLTFHPMMVPLMFPYIDWRYWIEEIAEEDPILFRDILRWLIYYFNNPEKTYEKYSSAHQVFKIVTSRLEEPQIAEIVDYAKAHPECAGPRG